MSLKYLKQSIITLLSLGLIFLANSILWAWTTPTANPPSGNIAAPINVSSVAQDKAGDLAIGSGLNYWITKYFDSFALRNNAGQTKFVLGQDGHVGIGTETPTAELEVKGNIKVSESSPVWADLGDQGNSINSIVVYNNKLYIGQINGYVKSYDGTAWTDLGGQGGAIYAMVIYNNKIYIGQSDGIVKSYDGSTWTSLGDQGDAIYSMAVYNYKLYIGQNDGYVKSYDGTAWTNIVDFGSVVIDSMAAYNNNLYIGRNDGFVESYNGSVWTDLGDQGPGVYSMDVYNYKLYIVQGDGYVKSYDGSTWTSLGDQGNTVYSVAAYNNKLYIGQSGGYLKSYNGSAWTDLGDQGDAIYSMAAYNNKLYLGQYEGQVKELNYSGMIGISDDIAATKGYVDNLPSVVTGEYTGNGALNRLIVVGFRPSLVMVGDTGGINSAAGRVTYIFGYRGSCGIGAWDGSGNGVWNCGITDEACALDSIGFRTGNTALLMANTSGRPYRYMAWR